MLKRSLFTIFSLLFVAGAASVSIAGTRDASNLLLYGSSAAAMGRGGTGLTSLSPDLFGYNPASAASLERVSESAQYGSLDGSYIDPSFALFIPTSYAVFGGYGRVLRYGDGEGLSRGYVGRGGVSKEISDRLSLGAAVDLAGGYAKGADFYGGLSLGAVYATDYEREFSRGFGIYRPVFGASVSGGLPLGSHPSLIDMNKGAAGFSFGFYRSSLMKVSFYNEYAAIQGYSAFPVTFGVESTIKDSFSVRLGGSYPAKYGLGDMTFGLGYRFDHRFFSASLNYALVHRSGRDFVHYVGVSAEFGELDRDPPAAVIGTTQQYISPNHDGVQDYALITLDVSDRSRIQGWRLQILDSAGSVVKEFRAPTRDMVSDLSLHDFFARLVSRREAAVVPDAVMWDGSDARGAVVPDGRYRYSFMVSDEHDNFSEKKEGEISVDSAAPSLELSSGELLFSPNGDGKKDEFVITQKVSSAPEDEWEASFNDSLGVKVKTYHWTGANPPASISWNGKSDSGSELPEGLYSYTVTSKDKAGNAVKRVLPEITLTRRNETADIYVQKETFSYLLDRTILFRPVVSSKKGMIAWRIIVEDENGKYLKAFSGQGPVPDKVEWNVADDVQIRVSDGIFRYSLATAYLSGSEPASFKKQILFDSTPPKVSVDFTPALFSPDGDRINDTLTIMPSAEDMSGIVQWNIDITYNGEKQRSILFKRFSGRGELPASLKWDGTGDRNELVESATDYYLSVSAADKTGNSAVSEKVTIPVDVLVMVTESGLKIRISTIEFEFDSAVLGKNSYRILSRVAQILDKYSRYKVRIEGHTDDIGDDAYNLKLSEDRALAVKTYLSGKGIDSARLSIIGRGETVPLVPNKDDESRRKNRRVEFVLEK